MLVPIHGEVVRSHSESQGEPSPMRGHQETAACGGGGLWEAEDEALIYGGSNKKTKGPSGPPHSHHCHWPPIEEFIYSDPGRRDVLKQRYN